MSAELQSLITAWRKEAASYAKSSLDSGLVDGASPKEQTAYQSQCATSASIYLMCAHDLEKIINAK